MVNDSTMSSFQGPIATQNPMSVHQSEAPQGPGALYAPVHDYHTSVPVQRQKVLIPPLALGDKDRDNLVIEPPKDHAYEIGEFVPQGFFDHVDQSWFLHRASRAEWTYSMRREAQQILPFLYLGPASVARDKTFLKNEGITLLFSIRDKRSAIARLLSGTKVAEELGIQSDAIDVDNDQELISLYPQLIRRINQHVVSGASAAFDLPPRVLVFCESGNGRSASVVIAYIMSMLNMDMPAAMWAVHHRRFCVDVDESMQTLLQSFQFILDAKREVVKARRQEAQTSYLAVQPPAKANSQLAKKRSFIDFDDDTAMLSNGHTNAYSLTAAQEKAATCEENPEHLKQKPAPFIERTF